MAAVSITIHDDTPKAIATAMANTDRIVSNLENTFRVASLARAQTRQPDTAR